VAEQLPSGGWEFRYRATWAGLLRAGFTCPAVVTRDGPGGWKIEAQQDLGPAFGGPFRSAGCVKDGVFLSTYESSADRGSMRMERAR
jgi:hypothetical protein